MHTMDLKNKSILITGGTGSFGHVFTKYLLDKTEVNRIVIFSRDEFKQYNMRNRFMAQDHRIRYFIGDVRDEPRLSRAINRVDYVVHAAAMKQVPTCEYNPIEAIKTNINGAMNVVNAALNSTTVKNVVALSTDKAVNPINLYGGTKLVSDKLFISANNYSTPNQSKFSVVRYGNVAGSRGSVIPFFMEKHKNNEKIPITDERMTRFYMTLDKASALVIKAFELAKSGETFVYKNPSFRVVDLAEAVAPDAKTEIVGICEGEKLHECMITESDARSTYEYDDYYIIYPQYDWWDAESGILKGGKKVASDFSYRSDNNTDWLTISDLKKCIKYLK